jgi:hypothetical protein
MEERVKIVMNASQSFYKAHLVSAQVFFVTNVKNRNIYV